MKAELFRAPWVESDPADLAKEAVDILGAGVWRDAAVQFVAVKLAKERAKTKPPKGIQPFINDVCHDAFVRSGWEGAGGRFVKGDVWVRVTFRHQMSLGSDLIDALRMCRKEGMRQAVILAASRRFLDLISPNDAGALTSFEKLRLQVADLKGCMDIPLFIGQLEPRSAIPANVMNVVLAGRPRDVYLPNPGP